MLQTIELKERQLIQQFRARLKDILPYEKLHNDNYLVRWLRARDLNLLKAETMLRKAVAWNKRNEFLTLLDWKPPINYYRFAMTGHDSEGCPVFIFPVGLWDLCDSPEQGDIAPSFRFMLRILARIEAEIKLSAKRLGRPVTQFVGIVDFQHFEYLKTINNRTVIQAVVEFCRIFEANFPETLKTCTIVNTAKIFPLILSVIKPFMSGRTMEKMEVHGSDRKKWIPALGKKVPMEILPPCYGGTRKGSDEFCSDSGIWNDEPLPVDYYNKNGYKDSRRGSIIDFGDDGSNGWTLEEIPAGSKLELSFPVSLDATETQKLAWQIRSDEYDVGFQVTFIPVEGKKLHNSVQDIIEYRRIDSHVTPCEGSVVCDKAGTYTLTLDNSYSRRRKKMVLHNIALAQLENDSVATLETYAAD